MPPSSDPSNLKERIKVLRESINLPTLDQLELMLNRTKGTGTTNALVKAAIDQNITLVTHSEEWADKLRQEHPKLPACSITAVRGGERVLIDNGVNWLLLKAAQKIRRQAEDLLNYMEQKKIKEPT